MRSFLAEGAGGGQCSIRTQPPGERPYFPLEGWGFTQGMVDEFWGGREFRLEIPENAGNCVFCFMKGPRGLAELAATPDPARVRGAPSDVQWWAATERRYRREALTLQNEGGFGFLGLSGPTFAQIAEGTLPVRTRYDSLNTPSCDCTD